MNTLDVVLLAIAVAAAIVVFVGSSIARRRAEAGDDKLRARLTAADEALAQARAADKGWDKALLEAAARAAAGPVDELQLTTVIDKPGTDEDECVFEATKDGQAREIRLRRTGDTWTAA